MEFSNDFLQYTQTEKESLLALLEVLKIDYDKNNDLTTLILNKSTPSETLVEVTNNEYVLTMKNGFDNSGRSCKIRTNDFNTIKELVKDIAERNKFQSLDEKINEYTDVKNYNPKQYENNLEK
jgi:hypothetical protein